MKKSGNELIYFDNSATTYIKPETVYEKIIDVMKYAGGNAGRGGHKLASRASDVIFDTRFKVCELFNIKSPEEVCFVSNASMGLNFIIKGFLKKGDHVIISPYEHNSVLRPVHKLSQKGVSYTITPVDEKGDYEDIEAIINPNTKLVIANHISNVSGRVSEIEKLRKITKKYDIKLLIDASQSAGHTKIDALKYADALVCSGHKGLFGPQGTGIMYVDNELKLDTLFEGGSGSMSELLDQPEYMPDRFETGTLNAPGIGGLGEGIKFLLGTGIENIEAYEKRLAKMLISGLKSIPGIRVYSNDSRNLLSGVVAFNFKDFDSVEIANILSEKYNIMVRGGLHCAMLAHKTLGTLSGGVVRASVCCFNTTSEVEKFLNVIDTMRV